MAVDILVHIGIIMLNELDLRSWFLHKSRCYQLLQDELVQPFLLVDHQTDAKYRRHEEAFSLKCQSISSNHEP